MMQVIEETKEQQTKSLMKLSKKELVSMLIESNNLLKLSVSLNGSKTYKPNFCK